MLIRGSAVSRRARRSAGVLGLVALFVASVPWPARAVPPAQDLAAYIQLVREELAGDNFEVWFWNFLYEVNGPDGQPGPDATPDGRGAFAYYHGPSTHTGAIYAYRPSLADPKRIYAWYIYGAILQSWMAAGHETGHGYPLSQEVDCELSRATHLCSTGDRVQLFVNLRTGKLTWARWRRSDGRVTWHPQ